MVRKSSLVMVGFIIYSNKMVGEPELLKLTEGISGLAYHSAMAGPLSTTKATERKVQFHKKRMMRKSKFG